MQMRVVGSVGASMRFGASFKPFFGLFFVKVLVRLAMVGRRR